MMQLEKVGFRNLIVNAIVLPLILLVGLACILFFQVKTLVDNVKSIEHSDLVLANINRLEKLHIDLETGVRGYLITADQKFLEPYNNALTGIKSTNDSALSLVSEEPRQKSILMNIAVLREKWLNFASQEIEDRKTGNEWQSSLAAGLGKSIMDQIRSQFAHIITIEEDERARNSHRAQNAVSRSLWISGLLTLAVGAMLAFFSKRQLEELSTTFGEALKTSVDLTAHLERRVAERTVELENLNRLLDEANKEMEAFSYSISHDLRAPLRHIAGFSDLLLKSKTLTSNPEDMENLCTIQSTARTAGHMVDDLLAFSRVGRVELRFSTVNMQSIVEASRKELQSEIGTREITWRVSDLPSASGDPALIKLVVQNLLSNAVKYTSTVAHAEIEIGAHSGETMVAYFVKDNGVGFDMNYAHKLFGVFQRLHRAEEFEGTGIGLANVRRIITRHGGTVSAEGQLGQGATFNFTLPRGAESSNADSKKNIVS